MSRRKARLTAGLMCLSFACGLPACGVSTEVYTRTLHERDQLRHQVKQAETEAAAQRQQADELRAGLTEQQQANHTLRARITELETQTADQNLAQEALARQLRSVSVEREELLLKLDESKAPSRDSTATASPGGGLSRSEEADAQQLTLSLHEGIEAGHLTIHRFTHGLDLRLSESFVFVPDKTEVTSEGQRLLSTIHTALSSIRLSRVLFRMPVPADAMEGGSELARINRTAAFNRLLVLAGQLGGRAESSELVLVAQREDARPLLRSLPRRGRRSLRGKFKCCWSGQPDHNTTSNMGVVAGHFLLTLQTSYAISGGLLRQKCWFYHGKCWFYRHIDYRPLPVGDPTLYAQ